MSIEQERDAYQWAASKQCILFERLYQLTKDIIKENNIQLTKEQIKKLNAYNTWSIRAWEHWDEMAFNDFPNWHFFQTIMDGTEDDQLLY